MAVETHIYDNKFFKNTIKFEADSASSFVDVVLRHYNPESIVDIGCGAGRTTFGLFESGFTHITGLDITPKMIEAAKNINQEKKCSIDFILADATNIPFENDTFDYALFSFNGIMEIPQRKERTKAMSEIKRVLKPGGIFIFTTHDRDMEPYFDEFWIDEKKKWESEKQDMRLFEFGDLITQSRNEIRDIFIHIPDRNEILKYIKETGFKLLEDKYRPEIADESKEVKDFSNECRFWVVQKEK